MGNFYANITVATPRAAALQILGTLGRTAWVACTPERWSIVCDRECEGQAPDVLASLALTLSTHACSAALAVLNHDDDVLLFGLFEQGTLSAQYGWKTWSSPWKVPSTSRSVFRGKVHRAFQTQRRPAVARPRSDALRSVLGRVATVMAMAEHQMLAAELGMPELSVGAGYRYVGNDEIPHGSRTDFVHT